MTNMGEGGSLKGIGAVILAAGLSRRMGGAKLVLPWAGRTVIEQVVGTLQAAGVEEIVAVTGGFREQVQTALENQPVKLVYNPDHVASEMLVSLQVGTRELSKEITALLVVLGDQPLIEVGVVRAVVEAHRVSGAKIVIPSYEMRRGHPWLVERSLWPGLLSLTREQTMRDFLTAHDREIEYVTVDSPWILKDMDTPEDYQEQRPK
jgi:molybdenum cofactor cytidylyltransferase